MTVVAAYPNNVSIDKDSLKFESTVFLKELILGSTDLIKLSENNYKKMSKELETLHLVAISASKVFELIASCDSLLHLSIECSDISDHDLGRLLKIKQASKLLTLSLICNDIEDAGAKQLVEAPQLTQLQSLNLKGNFISSSLKNDLINKANQRGLSLKV